MTRQVLFFATRDDFLPVIDEFESKAQVYYVREGMFELPTVIKYDSARAIPAFGTSECGDWMCAEQFLIFPIGVHCWINRIPQVRGGVRYDVGIIGNQRTISWTPSGIFAPDVLIAGMTTSHTADWPESLALFNTFARAVRKRFHRVHEFWLGDEAYRMLQRGARLTCGVKRPSGADLRLD